MIIETTKGKAGPFGTIEAAARWLVAMQPSYASVGGHDIDGDGIETWTMRSAVERIAAAIGEEVEELPETQPVLVEVARCDETIRDRGGIHEFAGLSHPAMVEACAAYHRAASAAIDDAGGRLAWSSPQGNRVLHSQWCGAQWGYSSGAIGTMARDLTDAEKATISAAADAGLAAARKVIEEADAQIAAADAEEAAGE